LALIDAGEDKYLQNEIEDSPLSIDDHSTLCVPHQQTAARVRDIGTLKGIPHGFLAHSHTNPHPNFAIAFHSRPRHAAF